MGTQVGSGVFSSPGVVVANVGSPGASLLVWIASACLAWTGARSVNFTFELYDRAQPRLYQGTDILQIALSSN